LHGKPRYVGKNYNSSLSCTESALYPEKTKELELNFWISDKNIWILFFGSPCRSKDDCQIKRRLSKSCLFHSSKLAASEIKLWNGLWSLSW